MQPLYKIAQKPDKEYFSDLGYLMKDSKDVSIGRFMFVLLVAMRGCREVCEWRSILAEHG